MNAQGLSNTFSELVCFFFLTKINHVSHLMSQLNLSINVSHGE